MMTEFVIFHRWLISSLDQWEASFSGSWVLKFLIQHFSRFDVSLFHILFFILFHSSTSSSLIIVSHILLLVFNFAFVYWTALSLFIQFAVFRSIRFVMMRSSKARQELNLIIASVELISSFIHTISIICLLS
jgi:hypothetical protein